MSKIIKVSTDLEITVHDFPEGSLREQNKQLCELIGNGCDMIEHVMPKRLYNELGHTRQISGKDSKCVSMLVDEEFMYRDNPQMNLIGCCLYETDKHHCPILGNVIFVGEAYVGDGIAFTGIEPEVFETLHQQLENMAMAIKAQNKVFKEVFGE